MILGAADIDWDGSVPVSQQYGDSYYSREGGLDESRHVFLTGIGAPDVWSGYDNFSIGETGFGTGLNFLATWELWRSSQQRSERLHFISVEAHPLGSQAMAKAHSLFPTISELSQKLRVALPPHQAGVHRMWFDDNRVSLTLLYGDGAKLLSQLIGDVDAWFLDGFAPQSNPSMWSDEIFQAISYRSKPGARVATYTSAGFVRRGLSAVGFEMERRPGFGKKRHMLQGYLKSPHVGRSNIPPWYATPKPVKQKARIAIIGAGIAGLSVAASLKSLGFSAHVFDTGKSAGRGASGNPAASLNPRLSADGGLEGQFFTSSFFHAIQLYSDIAQSNPDVWAYSGGLLQVDRDDADKIRYDKCAELAVMPADWMERVHSKRVSEIAGIPLERDGLWFPKSGCVRPAAILNELMADVECHFDCTVRQLKLSGEVWQLLGQAAEIIYEADATVIAAGPHTFNFEQCDGVPFVAKRGQVSTALPTSESADLKTVLTGGAQVTPPIMIDGEHRHLVGSTFERWNDFGTDKWAMLSALNEQQNLSKAKERFGLDFAHPNSTPSGRASLRSVTQDYLPVCGPVPDVRTYNQVYDDLHHGRPTDRYTSAPYFPNLFLLAGLGSRGFVTAPLLAEVLAAQITGTVLPIPMDMMTMLHPARFAIRSLRRGRPFMVAM